MKSLLYFVLIPALLPVFVILFYVYRKDKVEREPLGMVLKVFLFGAVFALPCAPVEKGLDYLITTYSTDALSCALYKNIFGVGLVEELSKWLVLMVFVWRNDNFDYRYDGIVYAVAASLGFAGIENIMYVITYGTSVSITRAIFSIPGHANFGVFMGYYLSRAKHFKLKNWQIMKGIYLVLSVAISMLIHGIYDFLILYSTPENNLTTYFIVYVIILDVFSYFRIRHEFKTDRPL